MSGVKIKTLLVGGVAALALMSSGLAFAADAPATAGEVAAPSIPAGLFLSGVAELSAGWRSVEATDDGTGDMPGVDAALRVSFPLTDYLSLQGDLSTEWYTKSPDNEGDIGEDVRTNSYVGAHLSLRDPSRGLVGVFGAYGHSALYEEDPYSMALLGVEGQAYVGQMTLYGQMGVGDVVSDPSNDNQGFNNGWFVRGVGRYFVADNTKLELEASYAAASPYTDGDDDGKFYGWGASAETRLTEAYPIHGTLSYRGTHLDATTEDDTQTEHTVMLGLKMLVGEDRTLLEVDRGGATLDLPGLPLRANGATELID